jgi:hypothetical protein
MKAAKRTRPEGVVHFDQNKKEYSVVLLEGAIVSGVKAWIRGFFPGGFSSV